MTRLAHLDTIHPVSSDSITLPVVICLSSNVRYLYIEMILSIQKIISLEFYDVPLIITCILISNIANEKLVRDVVWVFLTGFHSQVHWVDHAHGTKIEKTFLKFNLMKRGSLIPRLTCQPATHPTSQAKWEGLWSSMNWIQPGSAGSLTPEAVSNRA